MTDYIEYELPVEALANIFAGKLIEHEVDKMFRFRQARTKALIEESMQARTAIAI